MSSFGEKMQREREMRNISLDEIAESTKIGCRMLRALEQEDFEKLPGGIFNKGFVRAYAKFLGLDEEQSVADFQVAFAEYQQKQAPAVMANGLAQVEALPKLEAYASAESQAQSDQAAGFMKAAIILIFVIGVGGFGWKYFQGKSATANQSEVQAASSAKSPGSVPAAVEPSKVEPQKAGGEPAKSDAFDGKASNQSTSAVSTNPGLPSTENLAPPSTPNADQKINLQVHAMQESWVQITADGKVLISEVLTPSTQKSFRATKEMVVKLGNAGGVELSYNGKPLPQFPPEMKSRTLTFTPGGLQQ